MGGVLLFKQPPAPPLTGFVGWGGISTNGHASAPNGHIELVVTNINDGGPGSFRAALQTVAGTGVGKYITFKKGATTGPIVLTSGDLQINKSYTTVDGLSAPFPGVTLQLYTNPGNNAIIQGFHIDGPVTDIIVRGIRSIGYGSQVHQGDQIPGLPGQFFSYDHQASGSGSSDCLGLDGGDGPIRRVIIDHCTLLDSSDGAIDFFGEVSDVTISNCLLSGCDLCMNSICGGSSTLHYKDRVTFYRNIWAKNSDRVVRYCAPCTQMDFVNNIIYGIDWWVNGSYNPSSSPPFKGIMSLQSTSQYPGPTQWFQTINIENNWLMNPIIARLGTRGRADSWIGEFHVSAPDSQIWIANNRYDLTETTTSTIGARISMGAAEVTHADANNLKAELLPACGTQFRTAAEAALFQEITDYVSP